MAGGDARRVGTPAAVVVREPRAEEREWVAGWLRRAWAGPTVVSRGRAHDASLLPALLAIDRGEVVGLATYRLADGECELVTLDALRRGRGVGTALLARVVGRAVERGCRRLWLVTTNDNLDAIGFYRRRGLRLVGVHRGAVDESRRAKPTIPLVGAHGIPIHDELEFELALRE